MFEYEKKVMLTEDEYLSITVLMSKFASMESQTNYYFDDDELSMNQKGITCRIRAKNGKYKATIKNHKTEHPDCSIEVTLVEKTEFDPQIFKIFGLRYQGELVTERAVIYEDSECKMVLDQNVYLGQTDFELEVEYCKKREQTAHILIENIAKYLIANKQLKKVEDFTARIGKGGTKSQRFFKRLKNYK